ncbi:MAG: uridine kinase [Bacteroidota bacterium]
MSSTSSPSPQPYFIGITGGSASGKTTLLRQLVSHFRDDQLTLISLDNYYISRDDLPRTLDGSINFDHPDAIDLDRFAADLKRIAAGETIELMEYTFNNPAIVPKKIVYAPAPLVVVEGLFVFNHAEAADMLDLKVFVDTEDYHRLSRRIVRDAKERGYGLDDVLSYYTRFVAPMYKQYIEPYKYGCDIVIPNNVRMDRGIQVLMHHLEAVVGD